MKIINNINPSTPKSIREHIDRSIQRNKDRGSQNFQHIVDLIEDDAAAISEFFSRRIEVIVDYKNETITSK